MSPDVLGQIRSLGGLPPSEPAPPMLAATIGESVTLRDRIMLAALPVTFAEALSGKVTYDDAIQETWDFADRTLAARQRGLVPEAKP